MSNHQAHSQSNTNGARMSHRHTCATAIETFTGAVVKNRARMSDDEANRNAIAWSRNVVCKQIPDANERASFERFLAEKEKSLPPRQNHGPKIYAITDVQRLLNGLASVTAMISHLLEHVREWEPGDRQAIESEMHAALASANRKRYAAEGTLDAATIERAEEDARRYLTNALRRTSGHGRPSHGNDRRHDNRPRPDARSTFARTFDVASPKPQVLKVRVAPATADENEANNLRSEIAQLESAFAADKEAPPDKRWGDEARADAVTTIKLAKDRLAEVKARISAAQQALADAKKKERIAAAAASAAASRAVPSNKVAAPKVRDEEGDAKGKKGGRKGGKR